MGIGATIIAALDKAFNYMPPIEHKKSQREATPQVVANVPDSDADSVRERIAGGTHLSPQIPGIVSAEGLSPEQRAHVLQTTTQSTNTDMLTPQLVGIAKKTGTVFVGATGSAIAAGQSGTDAIAAGASAAGPAIVVTADAAMLGIALVDMFGGDFSISTNASLNPEFDATTAAGRFHGTEEGKVINASLAATGGAVKFRTSGQLTDDSVASVPDAAPISLAQGLTLGITGSVLQNRAAKVAIDDGVGGTFFSSDDV